MKILAIDTSEKAACIAICEDRHPIALYTVNAGLTQSETMMPMVSSALRDARLTADDIDLFACTTGPGSFTGVRIGVSLVKGLAFGKSKVCVGVSSLEALARNVYYEDRVIVPVTDARQGRVYSAAFRCKNGKYERILPDDVCTAGELSVKLGEYRNVSFIGNGRGVIESAIGEKTLPLFPICDIPSGYSVAMAALDKFEAATESEKPGFTDVNLCPVYLRPSQAERTLEEKEKQNG